MVEGLENLADMEYPGRAIILGMDETGNNRIVVYILSGRSASSQARTAERYDEHGFVNIEPTDRKVLESGSPSLLLYPAMFSFNSVPNVGQPRPDLGGNVVGVSNGAQTNLLYEAMKRRFNFTSPPGYVIDEAMKEPRLVLCPKFGEIDITSFEPDAPNYTPRISGLVLKSRAALHIARRGESGLRETEEFEFDYDAGQGKMIATYDGVDTGREPLHPFTGEPLDVKLDGVNAQDMAIAVYDALNPAVRVSVVTAYVPREGPVNISVVNRHGLGGGGE